MPRRPLSWPAERQAFATMSQIAWLFTACFAAVVAAILWTSGLAIEADTYPLNGVVFPVFGAVAVFYTYVRHDAAIASAADAIALATASTMIAAVFTYGMTYLAAGKPLVDAQFLAADRALGFDWLAAVAWLNGHPTLARILDASYLSLLQQTPLLIGALAFTGRRARLQIVLLAMLLCLVACGLGAYLLPAIGIYEHLEVAAALHHPDVPLATRDAHVAEVMQLRGPNPIVSLSRIEGIIVFPSFHMALAVLFGWGFWSVPYLRWPALALNLAMAAATPFSGGHYLVDLMAGGVLAVAALAAAKWVRQWCEERAGLARPVAVAGAVPVGPVTAPA